MDKFTDAPLYLGVGLNTILKVMVLQFKELVEVGLHLILHLDRLTEQLFRVDAVVAIFTTEFEFLQLLTVGVFQLGNRIIIQ